MDKFLYYPYKPFIVGQHFGDNRVCVIDNGVVPVSKRKQYANKLPNGKCPPGFTELYPLLGFKGHTGTDIFGKRGNQPTRSPINGTVIEVVTETERGLGVGIVSDTMHDLGPEYGRQYVKIRQWHLISISKGIEVGARVRIGDALGIPDSTGISTGDHIHFELKPVSPRYIPHQYNDEGWKNVFQNNGYFGSIDPSPYWVGEYASDYASIPVALSLIDLLKQAIAYFSGRRG